MSIGRLQTAPDYAAPGRLPSAAKLTPSWRVLAAILLLLVVFGVALVEGSGRPAATFGPRSASPAHTGQYTHAGLLSLPLAAQGPVSAALGADSSGYRISADHGVPRTTSSSQGLSASFLRSGASVSAGAAHVALSLRSIAYGSSRTALGEPTPRLDGNKVTYAHGALTEWYTNGPLGLEQGFTLARAPVGHLSGPLTLSMALSGNAAATLSADGQSLTFSRGSRSVLRYDGLSATDARGRVLRSWLQLQAGRLLLRVDAQGAHYPLRIDPLIQEAELTASDGKRGDTFGDAVAIAGDTIVVGARQYNNGVYGVGKAYVFVRPTSGWANAKQTAELTGTNSEAEDLFGMSVAVSGDTVVVGAPEQTTHGPERDQGAVYVFVKPASGWSGELHQTAELTGSDSAILSGFGESVAVSGETIVASSLARTPDADAGGAAYVFEMPQGGWKDATQTAELTASQSWEGWGFDSVAISHNTIFAGVPFRLIRETATEYLPSAAFVFEKPASGGWKDAIQTAELTTSDGGHTSSFGISIAAYNNTVVVGASRETVDANANQGAAFVFERPASGPWLDATQNAELTQSEVIEGFSTGFGSAVGIAGKTIAVGDPTHYSSMYERVVGTIDLFEEPASGHWASATQNSELSASGSPGPELGYQVAMSSPEESESEQPTIVAGSPGAVIEDHGEQGDAFVFGVPGEHAKTEKEPEPKEPEPKGPEPKGPEGKEVQPLPEPKVVIPGGQAPAPIPTPPVLSAVTLTNLRFQVAKQATAISAGKAPLGTAFRFTLSAAAEVKIAITRTTSGLAKGHSCGAPTPKLKRAHAKHCTRTLTVGALTRSNELPGADTVAFSGRIGTKALAPGAYAATLSASNAAGDSNATTLKFKIVK